MIASPPSPDRRRPSRASVALVVAGGGIWIAAAIAYSVAVVTCFTCASVVVATGVDTSDYSAGAVRTLAWDAMYANLYILVVGFLAVLVVLTAFRRGERWAWFAMAAIALGGVLTAVFDQLAWGGWYTFLFLGLLPTAGVLVAAPRMLRRQPGGSDGPEGRPDGPAG